MSAALSPRIRAMGGVSRVRHHRLRTLRLLRWQDRAGALAAQCRAAACPWGRRWMAQALRHALAWVALLEAMHDGARAEVQRHVAALRQARAVAIREDA